MTHSTQRAIVIGAGIAGCATAYRLAAMGYQVQLLEQAADIAQRASGNPAAVIYPRLSDASSPIDQYALAAYTHTLQLLKALPDAKAAFHACGLLQLGINSREAQRIQKVAQRRFNECAITLLNAEAASAIAHVKINHAALYFAEAGYVLPQVLCRMLVNAPNITVFPDTIAENLISHDDGWQVKTNNGAFETDVVVICNAHAAQAFTQTAHLPMQTVRGQINMVAATTQSQNLQCVLCGDGYITPTVHTNHCIGATFTPNSQNLALSAVDSQHNCEMAQSLSTDFSQLNQVTQSRAALRTTTADYLPLVGPVIDAQALEHSLPKHLSPAPSLPLHQGLFVNLAHGSRGFISAPLGAEIISQYLNTNQDPSTELLGLCQPNRFLLREMGLKNLNMHVVSQALSSLA